MSSSSASSSASISTEVGEDKSGMRDLGTLKVGDKLKGIVVSELDGKTGKKAWVRLGVRRRAKGGRYAFVDGMIRLYKEKGLKPRKVAINKPLTVFVKEVSVAQGRLEVSLRRPRIPPSREKLDALRPLAELAVGDKLQGVVVSVVPSAAFVRCGVGRPTKRNGPDGKPARLQEEWGLLTKYDLPQDVALSSQLVKSEDIKEVIDVGDAVTVYVKDVLTSNGRFRLTLDPEVTPEKVAQQKREFLQRESKWRNRKAVAELEVGKEMLGEIVKVSEYGFFVDVGAKRNGLVHISSVNEMEDRYLGQLNTFADVGDKMYVTVRGVSPEGRLSLAYVMREKERPKGPNRRERRRTARGESDGVVPDESDAPSRVGDEDSGTLAWDEPFAGLDDYDEDDGFEDIF